VKNSFDSKKRLYFGVIGCERRTCAEFNCIII